MEKHIVKVLLLLLLMLGFAGNGIAQPPGDPNKPPTKEQMEKVRKRIETLRMWKLTKDLDLDEKTSAQLFPLLNKYDKKRAGIEIDMREGMKELRESLKEKREGQLKSILERLEQNHKNMQRINDEEREDLKRILTIEQQAKFIIFQHEFDREIKRIIAEVRERRHERSGSERPERPLPPERR